MSSSSLYSTIFNIVQGLVNPHCLLYDDGKNLEILLLDTAGYCTLAPSIFLMHLCMPWAFLCTNTWSSCYHSLSAHFTAVSKSTDVVNKPPWAHLLCECSGENR